MDVLAGFLDECCDLGPATRAPATPLFQAYEVWCKRSGERAVSQRAFGVRLAERGFTKVRGGRTGGYVWHGIGLLNQLNGAEPISGNSPIESPTREVTGNRFSTVRNVQEELERESIQAEGAA